MESRFENTCAFNDTNLEELLRGAQNQLIVIVSWVLAGVSLALAIAILVLDRSDSTGQSALLLIALSLVLSAGTIFAPKFQAQRILRQNQRETSSLPVVRLAFFDDHLLSTNGQTGGEVELNYRDIQSIKETKHLLLLLQPRRLVIPVEKNGFTKGDTAAFLPFMKEKLGQK